MTALSLSWKRLLHGLCEPVCSQEPHLWQFPTLYAPDFLSSAESSFPINPWDIQALWLIVIPSYDLLWSGTYLPSRVTVTELGPNLCTQSSSLSFNIILKFQAQCTLWSGPHSSLSTLFIPAFSPGTGRTFYAFVFCRNRTPLLLLLLFIYIFTEFILTPNFPSKFNSTGMDYSTHGFQEQQERLLFGVEN